MRRRLNAASRSNFKEELSMCAFGYLCLAIILFPILVAVAFELWDWATDIFEKNGE